MHNVTTIHHLPLDILTYIFKTLDNRSASRCRLVCKNWDTSVNKNTELRNRLIWLKPKITIMENHDNLISELNILKTVSGNTVGRIIDYHFISSVQASILKWKGSYSDFLTWLDNTYMSKSYKSYMDKNHNYVLMTDVYDIESPLIFMSSVAAMCGPQSKIQLEIIKYPFISNPINNIKLPKGKWNGYDTLHRGTIILIRVPPKGKTTLPRKISYERESYIKKIFHSKGLYSRINALL